jgi:cephalosporin hydroxylase
MNEKEFEIRNKQMIRKLGKNRSLKQLSIRWLMVSSLFEYSYHFSWLGRPIIQFPQDMIAVQEIIWKTKPELIIETGIARGGSLIFSASILELLGNGKVIGIDIDIHKENRRKIEQHPLAKRIIMIEGSSTDESVVKKVHKIAKGKKRIMVMLDSNHTHEHVLNELQSYSGLVTKGSYLIVFDTIIDDIPIKMQKKLVKGKWSVGNSPKSAVIEFLNQTNRFVVDKEIENKLLITVAPHGFLKCIK